MMNITGSSGSFDHSLVAKIILLMPTKIPYYSEPNPGRCFPFLEWRSYHQTRTEKHGLKALLYPSHDSKEDGQITMRG